MVSYTPPTAERIAGFLGEVLYIRPRFEKVNLLRNRHFEGNDSNAATYH
jgi:hypothetical protein